MQRLTLIGIMLMCGYFAASQGAKYLTDEDFEELYEEYLMRKTVEDLPRSKVQSLPKDNKEITKATIKMPGVSPKKHDSYICTSLKMPEDDTYIVGFEPTAEMNTAHHMLMFGCSEPFSNAATWNCGEMSPVCGGYGGQRIMYAWGRNAPKLNLPKGVGFKAGGDTDVQYLVLQVHYGNVQKFTDGKLKDFSGVILSSTAQRQKYLAGIYLVAAGWSSIPPHKKKWHLDASCEFVDRITIYPFAFRVHAHKLGDVVTGYRVRDGKWELIGKGDPQRPQAFYPLKKKVEIKRNDDLVARCTYNSMTRDTVTNIGATMKDEMCNFYIMYFYDHDKFPVAPPTTCGTVGSYENVLYSSFPAGSDIMLPGGHPKMNMGHEHSARTMTTSAPSLTYKLSGDLFHRYAAVADITQACAVDVSSDQNQVVVLHRGDRAWGSNTFGIDNIFNPDLGRIKHNTLLYIDIKSGSVVKAWGKDMFYLPHGLTIDHAGNIWITDVGSHQVFKFSSKMDRAPLLVLGKKMVPGSDDSHFCKPTDVAVDPTGAFYVSDGYCNQRIMIFSADGKLVGKITPSKSAGLPKPINFLVPHSLALDAANSILWMADRENHRVLQYNSRTFAFIKEFVSMDQAVYAVAYSGGIQSGLVHLITYPDMRDDYSKGMTYNASSSELLTSWKANQGFTKPHDVATTKDGTHLFVIELDPPSLWHFKKDT